MPGGELKEMKIVVLGIGGVGKSALTMQFVQSLFVERYDPTIEDSYRKIIDIPTSWLNQKDRSSIKNDGTTPIILEIMDTAGTDQFTAMRELYMRNGDAFMMVYSIDSPATFAALDSLHEQLLRVRNSSPGKIPLILVGNKSDLESTRAIDHQQANGKAMQWRLKAQPMETSARKNYNVSEAFIRLVKIALTESPAPLVAIRQAEKRKKNCSIL